MTNIQNIVAAPRGKSNETGKINHTACFHAVRFLGFVGAPNRIFPVGRRIHQITIAETHIVIIPNKKVC